MEGSQSQQRDREPWGSLALYRLFKWGVVIPTLHTYFRGRVYGLDNVPKRGRVLVVANHASDFDPPFLSASAGRPLAYMAKEELFRVPLLGPAIRLYGAYPVKRGKGDRAAIRAAIEQLEAGWAVGIFLSGTRTPDGRVHDPKLGAALIAAKTQTPLLPACVWGTDRILQKGQVFPRSVPVTIRYGEMMPPPATSQRHDLEEATQRCVDAIHAMHDLQR